MKKTAMLLYLMMQIILSWAQTPYPQQIKKADSLYKIKDYKNAAITYQNAFRLNEQIVDADERYNAACTWALAGDANKAFENLELIIGKNYFNYDHLLTDNDLNTIRSDKRWLPLLQKIKTAKPVLISPGKLYQDFDLLISALKEAHTGLYWYISRPQFDSICTAQRLKIKPGMTDLDFYNIVAPIGAFIKEGHNTLHLAAQTQAYLRFSGKYFPICIKFLNKKAYIINDAAGAKLRGFILTKINGRPIDDLVQQFMSYEPSDGYNTTGKYRWIEENGKFSIYYARCYPPVDFFDIEVSDPANGEKKLLNHIPSLSFDDFVKQIRMVAGQIPGITYASPAKLKIDTLSNTAVLTINTFSSSRYRAAGMKFHNFIDSAFATINARHIKHLVIDVRKNGGGTEGYEDYLLAYLTDKDYLKYKYVQASAFTYSFYRYTDYKNDYKDLDNELKEEHYLEKDGRVLRRPGIQEHEKPKPGSFKGDIYILISGLTYSGGSEFTSLARNHTNAVFIGEETGGGYYGNTSGIRITLTLPNSKLEVGIPILKFIVDTPKGDIPFGRGTLPDYETTPTINQFLTGYDAEMEKAKQLINKK